MGEIWQNWSDYCETTSPNDIYKGSPRDLYMARPPAEHRWLAQKASECQPSINSSRMDPMTNAYRCKHSKTTALFHPPGFILSKSPAVLPYQSI